MKRFHVSKNLIPEIVQGGVSAADGSFSNNTTRIRTNYINVESGKTYSVNSGNLFLATGCYYMDGTFKGKIDDVIANYATGTFTVPDNVNQVAIGFRKADGTINITPSDIENYILCEGTTTEPYEPYGNSWQPLTPKIYNTATDTITTLPAILYPNGTTATVRLKGNTVQNGTPTPSNPVDVQGVGTLDGGQYKIPISSASTTTPVYLGEVETMRKVRKRVFTGEEAWSFNDATGVLYTFDITGFLATEGITCACSHYPAQANANGVAEVQNKHVCFRASTYNQLYLKDTDFNSTDALKSYLAQQYAAGTPVTIWYVLATEITGIVNEPLMRIGNYADEVSGITIPTIAGANTLSVDTTLQPSEVTVNYNGWHNSSVEEWDGSQWI